MLSIGLVIGMVPMNVMAQNGPCQDEYPPAYIEFFDGENGTYIYSTFSQDQIGKIEGVSYDKKRRKANYECNGRRFQDSFKR